VDIAQLIYAAIASLDGYLEDQEGRFDWAEPAGVLDQLEARSEIVREGKVNSPELGV